MDCFRIRRKALKALLPMAGFKEHHLGGWSGFIKLTIAAISAEVIAETSLSLDWSNFSYST
jgi:hypothetical protein